MSYGTVTSEKAREGFPRGVRLTFSAAMAGSVLLQYLVSSKMIPGLFQTLWLYALCAALILYELFRGGIRILQKDVQSFAAALLMVASSYLSFLFFQSNELGSGSMLKTLFSSGPLLAAVLFCQFVSYRYLFTALAASLTHVSEQAASSKNRRVWMVILLCVVCGILLLQYTGYYPYGKSPDAQQQWDQIHGVVDYNTIHAIGHTIFLKALLSIWDNYQFVILVQLAVVLLLYLSAGYSALTLLPGWFVVPVIGFSTIWMTMATPAMYYPWKDTPAACCLMVVSIMIARTLDQEKLTVWQAALTGFALAWCCLFRLNGVIATLICGIYFVVFFLNRGMKKQLGALCLCIAVSFAGVKIYSEQVLHPISLKNGFGLQVFGSGIAAVVNSGELSDAELEEIDRILPVDWMQEQYQHPWQKEGLFWSQDGSALIKENPDLALMNNEYVVRLGENREQVIRLYIRLAGSHFRVLLSDLLGNWSIVFLQYHLYFAASHIFPTLLLGFMILKMKIPRRYFAVLLPCICNTVSIMISAVTNEMRYLLPSYLVFPFLFLYLIGVSTGTEGIRKTKTAGNNL